MLYSPRAFVVVRKPLPAGDTVTYRVKISNPGNVILKSVQIVSNVEPALSYNESAIADNLSLSEEVVLESNITYNNSMIRDVNMVLWANVTATSAAGNTSKNVPVTITPGRCTVNATGE